MANCERLDFRALAPVPARERGAALVETALAVLFVTVLLISIMELAVVFSRHARLTYALTREARRAAIDTAGVGHPTLNLSMTSCRQNLAEYAVVQAASRAQRLVNLGPGAMPAPSWDAAYDGFDASFTGRALVEVGGNKIMSGVSCRMINNGVRNICVPVLHLRGEVAAECLFCRWLPPSMMLESRVDVVIEDECVFDSVTPCCPTSCTP